MRRTWRDRSSHNFLAKTDAMLDTALAAPDNGAGLKLHSKKSMPRIALHDSIRRKSDVLSAEVGDEVVIMAPEEGKYYGLDAVGSAIWDRLAEPTTPARLIAELVGAYDGDPAAIEGDTMALLERLSDRHLLECLAERP